MTVLGVPLGYWILAVLVVATVALTVSATRRRTRGRRVAAVAAGAALVAYLALLLFLATSGGRPSGMDQRTYDLAQEAIEVGEGYLDGTMSASGAGARLAVIYDELGAYSPSDTSTHALVSTTVLDMRARTSGVIDADDGQVREDVDRLRGYCE